MRVANVGGRATLMTVKGHGLDIHEASAGRFDSDPQAIFENWVEISTWASNRAADQFAFVDEAEILEPVPRPRQVFGIAANYRAHAAEAGIDPPDVPVIFTKFVSCLTGPFAAIDLPSGFVDWEAELVVVIGQETQNVTETEAWSYVAGLTVGQDLSERVLQRQGPLPQISMAKSLAGFGPIGPVVVSADEFDDPDDLELGCSLNGEVMQRSRTSDLVFSVSELVAHISTYCRLYPGDLIFTGTPEGVGATRKPPRFLTENDVLTTYVEGVGELRNRMVRGTTSNIGEFR